MFNDEKDSHKNRNCVHDEGDNSKKNVDGSADCTKYGETIPSLFSWLSVEEQRKRADELSKITNLDVERKKKQ